MNMISVNIHHNVLMQTATLHAGLSKARRTKVGACLVTANGTIVPSWNGTPQGTDNNCENEPEEGILVTKPEVIHAELGCILKCAKEGINTLGSSVYVTLSPCKPCSAMLLQAGVRHVFYREQYRDVGGLDYLKDNGVRVEQL
jgi:dCMP deaminase